MYTCRPVAGDTCRIAFNSFDYSNNPKPAEMYGCGKTFLLAGLLLQCANFFDIKIDVSNVSKKYKLALTTTLSPAATQVDQYVKCNPAQDVRE